MNQESNAIKLRWLRPSEAAKYLGLAVSTLAKLRVTGEGPAYSILGRRAVVYDLEELNTWAIERKRSSTSDMESMS